MLIKKINSSVLLRILVVIFLFIAKCGFAINFVNAISPRNVERAKRKQTKYIILHTTEAPDKSSLASLKRYGEANYMVSTGGTVYRIIDHRRVAYHAGVSMWNGKTHLDKTSVGIEVVGYHNKSITKAQYTAVAALVSELQGIYRISDKNVLTHSMIAYGVPNKWHKKKHRGRKRCGMQFATDSVRSRLGLTDRYLYDPDVKAGRLTIGDKYLYGVLYAKKTYNSKSFPIVNVADLNTQYDPHVVVKGKSPWDTVGLQSQLPSTLYVFPDGKRCLAKDIKNWNKIPAGTKIYVKKSITSSSNKSFVSVKSSTSKKSNISNNTSVKKTKQKDDKIFFEKSFDDFYGEYETNIVVKGKSPWDIVGYKCKSDDTLYIFPDGNKCLAPAIKSWSKIPVGTKILIAKESNIIDDVDIKAIKDLNLEEAIKDVDIEEAIKDVVNNVLTNPEVSKQIAIIAEEIVRNTANNIVTNSVSKQSLDIVEQSTSENYVFTDALNGQSVILNEHEVCSTDNIFLVRKGIKCANELSLKELKDLNKGTKLLVGYKEMGILGGTKSAFDIVSYRWNQKETVYYLPATGMIVSGDKIEEHSMLKGTHLLLKIENK
jgi:hypothetical protein